MDFVVYDCIYLHVFVPFQRYLTPFYRCYVIKVRPGFCVPPIVPGSSGWLAFKKYSDIVQTIHLFESQ